MGVGRLYEIEGRQECGTTVKQAMRDIDWLLARVRQLEAAGRDACAHLESLLEGVGNCQECALGQNDPPIDALRDAVGICRRGRPCYRCWT